MLSTDVAEGCVLDVVDDVVASVKVDVIVGVPPELRVDCADDEVLVEIEDEATVPGVLVAVCWDTRVTVTAGGQDIP